MTMTSIMKWLTRGSKVAPKYKMVDNQLILENGDKLTRSNINAEIRNQTCGILVSQRKITLLNRQLRQLKVIAEGNKQ
jgi:hypothetical protein